MWWGDPFQINNITTMGILKLFSPSHHKEGPPPNTGRILGGVKWIFLFAHNIDIFNTDPSEKVEFPKMIVFGGLGSVPISCGGCY